MSEDELHRHSNPDSYLTDPVDVFDAVAEPVPPGTKAPPRPPGKESVPIAQPQPDLAALVARIESALEMIHMALAEIKRLQNPPQPQSKTA